MQNATGPVQRRPSGANLTIRVTVTREGMLTAPRAAVSVPYGFEPEPKGLGTHLPPCVWALHHTIGVVW